MAYAGSLPCGCIVSVIVDNPHDSREVARTVSAMVIGGETVDRRPVSELKIDPAFLRDCGELSHLHPPPATRHRQQLAPGSAVRTD
jgi:hypothetical protein